MLVKLQVGLASVLVIGGVLAVSVERVIAQIVPDATLGAESSVVTPQAPGSNVDSIQGGATRGRGQMSIRAKSYAKPKSCSR
jgi:hypothetical protein